jgi:FkbM family methyltransferase
MDDRHSRSPWRLHVFHVGARGETQTFPSFGEFDADVVNVLFEADASAEGEIHAIHRNRKAEIVVAPVALAKNTGKADFHIARLGYNCSMKAPNLTMGSFFIPFTDYDHDHIEAAQTIKTIRVDAISLDDFVFRSDYAGNGPDFLSVDCEGADLDVLHGAAACLDTAVCIAVETEFVRLYEDQPLFSNIADFLDERGFVLASIDEMLFGHITRLPLGIRGRPMPCTANSFFLADPARIVEHESPPVASRRLYKLAFASLLLGFTEHAFHAIRTARKVGEDMPEMPCETVGWIGFVERFDEMVRAAFDHSVFPPTFDAIDALRSDAERGELFAPVTDRFPSALETNRNLVDEFRRVGLSYAAKKLVERMDADSQRLSRWVSTPATPPPASPPTKKPSPPADKADSKAANGGLLGALFGSASRKTRSEPTPVKADPHENLLKELGDYRHAFETTAQDRDRWKDKAEGLEHELAFLRARKD